MARRPRTTVSLLHLTRRAVAYGVALELDDAAELAARLYRYNSLPATAAWRRRVPHERAAARLLGLDSTGAAHRRAIWQVWDAAEAPRHDASFKLYVSPAPAETGRACRLLLAELGRADGPFSVKVAMAPASLLRPDRLIGYFSTLEACRATAHRLLPRLAGIAAHGVPFTAALGRTSLLSWGTDPPADVAAALPPDERSWRGWVTARLAEAIVASRAEARGTGRGSSVRASSHANIAGAALDRLRDVGVDTARWIPRWG